MSEAGIKPGGWFGRLQAGLTRSSAKLGEGIAGIFTKRKLDDGAIEELEELLIGADLGVATAATLTAPTGNASKCNPSSAPLRASSSEPCSTSSAHVPWIGRATLAM